MTASNFTKNIVPSAGCTVTGVDAAEANGHQRCNHEATAEFNAGFCAF